ncbi:organic cation transporter protein-like isoform X1 [Saccostrea echinata]|uniref:organic cation transporter protein-like isoform X1 n=1 Tax=Saccostrea echinata TaxID=191078 RepID=UPI002A83B594|nr:organic cation transporter protein-like isoform X1 [Saccostrea echinata]
MHFDELLGVLGEFGPYQKYVYFLVCLPSIIAAFHMVNSVFLLGIPKHRCKLPNYPNDTYLSQGPAHDDLIKAYIPTELNADNDVVNKKCKIFSIPVLDNVTTGIEQSCSSWVYDKTVYDSTFASEQNLICDKQLWASNAKMVFFAGVFFGALGLGALADKIGRKKTLILSILVLLASSLAVSWAANFYLFCVLRFIVGFSCAGTFMSAFVLGVEIVGPSKRLWAGVVIEYFFAIGLVILCLIGYLIRDWKYNEIAVSVPSALLLSYWWLLPESPRWLINRRKYEEAKVIIRKIANRNKVEVTDKQLDSLECDETATGQLWHLFTSRVLFVRTIIIFLNWCVVSMVYYGLSLNSGNLAGDFYLNFFLTGLVEFPAYTLCLVLLDRIGRKKLHCACMVLGGLACISTIFTVLYIGKSHQMYTTVILAMIGKIGAAAAFAVIYVWSAELYPTVVRNVAMGASSSCARIGGMVSPYVADLSLIVDGHFGQALPLVVFGGASILAGLLSLILPETLGANLPETIQDGKDFPPPKQTKKYEENGSSYTYRNESFIVDTSKF